MNYRITNFKVLKFPACLGNRLIINEVFISVLFNYLFLSNILPGCYTGHIILVFILYSTMNVLCYRMIVNLGVYLGCLSCSQQI